MYAIYGIIKDSRAVCCNNGAPRNANNGGSDKAIRPPYTLDMVSVEQLEDAETIQTPDTCGTVRYTIVKHNQCCDSTDESEQSFSA